MVRFNRSMDDVCELIVKSPGGSDNRPSVDPHHAIMASGLDHLRVERRGAEDPMDDLPVELESVRDDHGTRPELHARRDVANERQGVPVATSPDDGRRPETRPHFNRRENPRRPGLPPSERADLVGLQLFGDEAGDPAVVKSTTHGGGPVEPAGDGVPASPSMRAIADRLTPSTLSVTTVSNGVLRCWRR